MIVGGYFLCSIYKPSTHVQNIATLTQAADEQLLARDCRVLLFVGEPCTAVHSTNSNNH